MIAAAHVVMAGMGEAVVSDDPAAVLVCLGLGSCIALCLYDPISRIGGLAHMVLPTRHSVDLTSSPSKFVDSGTLILLQEMAAAGAVRSRLTARAAGGARMLSVPGQQSCLDIGQKNITQICATLERERLRARATELGGVLGRTVQFEVSTGKVTVKASGGRITEL